MEHTINFPNPGDLSSRQICPRCGQPADVLVPVCAHADWCLKCAEAHARPEVRSQSDPSRSPEYPAVMNAGGTPATEPRPVVSDGDGKSPCAALCVRCNKRLVKYPKRQWCRPCYEAAHRRGEVGNGRDTRSREFEPTTEYRHLLRPEVRKRLEDREAK